MLLSFRRLAASRRRALGKLIHGREYAATWVPLAPLYTKVQSILTAISVQQASPTPPPLVLNKHCAECRYAAQCREIATKADDLSLLAKMSEKGRQKYREKGIFTSPSCRTPSGPGGDL